MTAREHARQLIREWNDALRASGADAILEDRITQALARAEALTRPLEIQLHDLRHAVWHALDDAEERVVENEIVLTRKHFETLCRLVPGEEHPDHSPTVDAHDAAVRQAAIESCCEALKVWAQERWDAEVRHRPRVNVSYRALDDTWKQVERDGPDALRRLT